MDGFLQRQAESTTAQGLASQCLTLLTSSLWQRRDQQADVQETSEETLTENCFPHETSVFLVVMRCPIVYNLQWDTYLLRRGIYLEYKSFALQQLNADTVMVM